MRNPGSGTETIEGWGGLTVQGDGGTVFARSKDTIVTSGDEVGI